MVEAVKTNTTQLQETQSKLTELMNERRRIWYECWKNKELTQTQIAELCGVTRQTVIIEIRKYEKSLKRVYQILHQTKT